MNTIMMNMVNIEPLDIMNNMNMLLDIMNNLSMANIELLDIMNTMNMVDIEPLDVMNHMNMANMELLDIMNNMNMVDIEPLDVMNHMNMANMELLDIMNNMNMPNIELLDIMNNMNVPNIKPLDIMNPVMNNLNMLNIELFQIMNNLNMLNIDRADTMNNMNSITIENIEQVNVMNNLNTLNICLIEASSSTPPSLAANSTHNHATEEGYTADKAGTSVLLAIKYIMNTMNMANIEPLNVMNTMNTANIEPRLDIMSRAMSHNERVYPDPETFNRDQFMKEGKLNSKICPGRHFAQTLMFIMITSVLHTLIIDHTKDKHGQPIILEVKMTNGVLFIRAHFPQHKAAHVLRESARQQIVWRRLEMWCGQVIMVKNTYVQR
ncbi:hypothetical protein C8Q80DRAFT_1122983 [Daedaleopsis nitida]|nr:hypothetical protein C8Q80DRAFT_1122983 [Daedaleopsis nitida]